MELGGKGKAERLLKTQLVPSPLIYFFLRGLLFLLKGRIKFYTILPINVIVSSFLFLIAKPPEYYPYLLSFLS